LQVIPQIHQLISLLLTVRLGSVTKLQAEWSHALRNGQSSGHVFLLFSQSINGSLTLGVTLKINSFISDYHSLTTKFWVPSADFRISHVLMVMQLDPDNLAATYFN
jgi:hypothetical protein